MHSFASKTAAAQARILGRYLLGEDPAANVVDMYERAVTFREAPAGEVERRIFEAAVRRPASMRYYDAACALFYPRGLLRDRLLLMSAILEAQPEYANLFLPMARDRLCCLRIAGASARFTVNALIGVVLLVF